MDRSETTSDTGFAAPVPMIREAPPITELVDDQPGDVQEQVWERVTQEAWEPFVRPDGRVSLPNEANWVAARSSA